MVFFRYDEVKKSLSKTFLKAKEDINTAQANRQQTISDLNRCGELSFMTPTGEKIVCPDQAGQDRLAWLKSQLSTHLPHDEKLTAILKYVEENAHQNGFLFAGRNGAAEIMAEKGIIRDANPNNNDESLNSTFGVTSNGILTYTEICHMPRAFVDGETGENLTSNSSVATITARSIISANPESKIEHSLDKIDVKIKDKIGLKIFQDTSATPDPAQPIDRSKASASDDRGVLKRISDFVSNTFKRLTESVSRSPRP